MNTVVEVVFGSKGNIFLETYILPQEATEYATAFVSAKFKYKAFILNHLNTITQHAQKACQRCFQIKVLGKSQFHLVLGNPRLLEIMILYPKSDHYDYSFKLHASKQSLSDTINTETVMVE